MDEESDYINQKQPCQFLNTDNTCQVYDVRPSDCAGYPYTDEDVLLKQRGTHLEKFGSMPSCIYDFRKVDSGRLTSLHKKTAPKGGL